MNSQEEMLAAYRAYPGASVPKEGRHGIAVAVTCPFHFEKTPSCYIYDDHFNCFSCSAHGSDANFLRRTRYANLSDADAYKAAYADLGISAPARKHTTPARSTIERWRMEARTAMVDHNSPTPAQVEAMTIAQQTYRHALELHSNVTATAYAEQRGLMSADGHPRHGVGFCRGIDLYAAIYNNRRGAQEIAEAAREIGLLGEDRTERMRGRLVIPDFDGTGRVRWMTGRAIPGLLPEEICKTRKYQHISVQKPLFGSGVHSSSKYVIIVEGQMCALALRGLGHASVALSSKSLADKHVLWFYNKAVTICLDNPTSESDAESLAAAARKLYEQLEHTARSVDYLELPWHIKDVSQYVETYGNFPL